MEDDFFLAQTLKDRFEFLGYATAYAENGVAALAYLAGSSADLIVMDILMPEMDGLTATRRIKAENKWKNIPIIVLTAKAREEDKAASLEAGASDYLAKPFQANELMEKIKKWMPK
ncbi:MAG: response regulator [bacterium]|nr:response regulator [bacterium]